MSKREAWIDNVKMVAMLFVVLGHTWRVIHCPLPELLSLFILSFNMALFVIMTGYTSINSINRIVSLSSLWDYLYKITKHILVPSLVFSLFARVLLQVEIFFITNEKSIVLFAYLLLLIAYIVAFYSRRKRIGGYLFDILCVLAIPLSLKLSLFWYFSMIWCVCGSVAVAAYILIKIKLGGVLQLYSTSFIISIIISVLYDKTSDFVHFFMIGYMLSRYKLIDMFVHIPISIFAIVAGLLLTIWAGEDTMNFWDYHFQNFFQAGLTHLYIIRIIASTLICMFFIGGIKKISKNYNLFSYWGSKTMPIYMVHGTIIMLLYLGTITFEIKGWSYLLYAIPMTLIITFLSIFLIKKTMNFAIVKAYCLGEIE